MKNAKANQQRFESFVSFFFQETSLGESRKCTIKKKKEERIINKMQPLTEKK